MEKIKVADLLAVILVLGYFVMTWKGIVLMIPNAILFVIAFYFGHKTSQVISNSDTVGE